MKYKIEQIAENHKLFGIKRKRLQIGEVATHEAKNCLPKLNKNKKTKLLCRQVSVNYANLLLAVRCFYLAFLVAVQLRNSLQEKVVEPKQSIVAPTIELSFAIGLPFYNFFRKNKY